MTSMRSWVLVAGGVSASSDAVYRDQNPLFPDHRTVEVNARRALGKVVEVGAPVPDAAYDINPRFEQMTLHGEKYATPRRYTSRADVGMGAQHLRAALARAIGQIPFPGAPGPYSLVAALVDESGDEVGRTTVEQR